MTWAVEDRVKVDIVLDRKTWQSNLANNMSDVINWM
jgi:hypothetical protein